MKVKLNRDEFSPKTKETLAKRAGFLCSICNALTVGPSLESIVSTNNIGVAAHITAAAPGGSRYDKSISPTQRSSISNGIWLCHSHATMIDRDCKTWTVSKLISYKEEHEKFVLSNLGFSNKLNFKSLNSLNNQATQNITPIEYGFIDVGALIETYKSFISPILQDKNLNDKSLIGLLMCGSPPEESSIKPSWTVFVNGFWLKWILEGQSSGYNIAIDLPIDQIYGQVPGWPGDFFEFLEAVVKTNTTFEWTRHKQGYLLLVQS